MKSGEVMGRLEFTAELGVLGGGSLNCHHINGVKVIITYDSTLGYSVTVVPLNSSEAVGFG